MAGTIVLGEGGLVEISRRLVTDPDRGPVTEIVWEGFEAPCRVEAVNLTNLYGAKCTVDQFKGPNYHLSAIFGDLQDGGTEVPVDRWERVTEFATFDIRNNPKFIELAGNIEELAKWVQNAKKCLKADPVAFSPISSDPNELHVFNFLAMGGTSYEVKRFVLRRRRTFSLAYADKAEADPLQKVYTTARLVTAFGVPPAIAALLPDDPDYTPEDCAWAWKERANNSEYVPYYGKIEEVMEWVYAAWNIYGYDLVS